MSKQMVRRVFNTEITGCKKLSEFKCDVEKLIDNFGDDAEINIWHSDWIVNEYVEYFTEETDAEYQARIDKELRINADIEKQERAKLAELKAKYES